MTSKEIKITYCEFESVEQLESADKALAEAAIEATSLSYAPYSNFNVGAAAMFEDAAIIKEQIKKTQHTRQVYAQKGQPCSMQLPADRTLP